MAEKKNGPTEGIGPANEGAKMSKKSAVPFTGVTLAIGVSTWLFSALKFQADMGLPLTLMFLVNMPGAALVLPALAAVLAPLLGVGRGPAAECLGRVPRRFILP